MKETKSLWHLSDNQSIIRNEIAVEASPGFCQIKSQFSLISTGTERLVAMGGVPNSIQEDMKVPYIEGSFQFPIKYGYSLVGEVITSGHFLEGKLVHLLHPHQNYCTVREEDLFEVAPNIPSKRATLAMDVNI